MYFVNITISCRHIYYECQGDIKFSGQRGTPTVVHSTLFGEKIYAIIKQIHTKRLILLLQLGPIVNDVRTLKRLPENASLTRV